MLVKSILAAMWISCQISMCANAQEGHHAHYGNASGHGSHHVFQPKIEKGPKGGKMLLDNGLKLKLEMVTPSGKKNDVSYFLYDTLSAPLNAQSYTGTVKYVFGGPNDFLETKLRLSGKDNQFVATMEGWQEYKKAIVTLKSTGEQTFTIIFPNIESENHKLHQKFGHPQGGH